MTARALLLGLCALLAVMPVRAQEALPIAIVDVESILQQSSASQSIRQKLDELSVDFQQRIDQEEAEIRAEERDIQQQQTLLAPEALRERRQAWQERAAGLQRRVATARRALSETANAATRHVQNILVEEVGKIAEERGLILVLPSSQTLYAADVMNLTEEALARLNERLPTVPIEFKESEPAAPAP